MAEAKFVEYVEGLGDIYIVYASFDKQVQVLKNIGIEAPESIRDASYARLYGNYSQGYTRTCHAPIYAKDSSVIIARMSPAIENPEMLSAMVSAHRNNKSPVFAKGIYGDWEKIAAQDKDEKPEERRAIILPERTECRIHRDSDEARFFWQDTREKYFKEKVIGDSVPAWQIPVNVVDSTDGTIINYVEFGRPDDESGLSFRVQYLNFDVSRVFGVLRKSAEGTSHFAKN